MEKVEPFWERRREVWERYMAELADLPLTLPAPVEPDTRHGFHLFSILVDEARAGISRDAFLTAMTKRKIGVGVHYLSIPEHPFYQERYGWSPDDYPNARDIGRRTVSLPISAKLTDEDVTDVIEAVRSILA
jgi:dTDP-4-amino-4,6-dideoxygalactose transaminase